MNKEEFIAWAREVGPKYQFSPQVAGQLSQVELIAIVGPTGAGKTTLIDALGIPIVRSDVTRDRRPDERRDDTYNFGLTMKKCVSRLRTGNLFSSWFVSLGSSTGHSRTPTQVMGSALWRWFAQAASEF